LDKKIMPTLLERHWPKLAIILTVSLLAGLLFVPALAQGFAMPLIALMLGMGILLLALRHWRAHREGKLSRRELARNVFVETASLLLIVVLARFVGGHVAEFVNGGYGWLLALLSTIVVGAAAGLAVKKTLGRLSKG
jgi:heme O synthase-like polyprenyltransferase